MDSHLKPRGEGLGWVCLKFQLLGRNRIIAMDMQLQIYTDKQGRCLLPGGKELRKDNPVVPEGFVGTFALIQS